MQRALWELTLYAAATCLENIQAVLHFNNFDRYIIPVRKQKLTFKTSSEALTRALLGGVSSFLEAYMTPYQSENITDLAKALLNVQRTVQPIVRDAENPFTESWYACLNSVMDACRDALIENGIWLCQ